MERENACKNNSLQSKMGEGEGEGDTVELKGLWNDA